MFRSFEARTLVWKAVSVCRLGRKHGTSLQTSCCDFALPVPPSYTRTPHAGVHAYRDGAQSTSIARCAWSGRSKLFLQRKEVANESFLNNTLFTLNKKLQACFYSSGYLSNRLANVVFLSVPPSFFPVTFVARRTRSASTLRCNASSCMTTDSKSSSAAGGGTTAP